MIITRAHGGGRLAAGVVLVATVAGGALALDRPVAPPAASVAPGDADHLVVVGADDPGSPAPPSTSDRFEYLAYFPDHLQVRRGDVVRFAWRGDHTVTFQPGGVRPRTLLAPDELPGQIRVDGVWPSRDDCDLGFDRAHLPPCVYSSADQYLNTGASPPSLEFGARIQFDLGPGTYAYFCSFHPQMRGEIEVVSDEVEILTPEEVEAERRDRVAADTAAAEAIIDGFRMPPPEVVDGHLRWQVQVGGSTPDGRVNILRYLPSNLTVAPGDEVHFVLPPSPMTEGHSVSFLPLPDAIRSQAPAHYLDLRCDQDGRQDGAPGLTGGVVFFLTTGGCPAGEMETVYQPWALAHPLRAPGDAVVGDQAVHDSGVMLTPRDGPCDDSCDPWTGRPLPAEFRATFPAAGSHEYWCFLHDPRGMAASITVAP